MRALGILTRTWYHGAFIITVFKFLTILTDGWVAVFPYRFVCVSMATKEVAHDPLGILATHLLWFRPSAYL